jgi:Phage lysozyme
MLKLHLVKTYLTLMHWQIFTDYAQIKKVTRSCESAGNARWNNVTTAVDTDPIIRTNSHGLGLLRRFENIQSYTEKSIREVEQAVLRQVHVPLTENQFAALVSFTYSLGEATLKRSVLLQHLNAGRYQAAANEFERWVYVGLNRNPQLVFRRSAERSLFLAAESSSSQS